MREAYDWEVKNFKQDIKHLKDEIFFIQWERQKANMLRWGIILASVFNSIAIIVLSVKTWR